MKKTIINQFNSIGLIFVAMMLLSQSHPVSAKGKRSNADKKTINLTGYVIRDITPESALLYFVETDGTRRLIAKSAFNQCATKYKEIKGRKVKLDVLLAKDKENSDIRKVVSADIIELPKVVIDELKPKIFKGKASKVFEQEGLLFATMVNKHWNWMFDADDGNIYVLNWNACGVHEFTLPMYKYKRATIKGKIIAADGNLFIDSIESIE
ncbi:hypothetical protein [Carboxylicivirga sp. RSCT41]|uniref:hypothetical protein n=1 Tax=Carboxylicivirga agarovorans TaxID=3417570 RepID=UPI003D338679